VPKRARIYIAGARSRILAPLSLSLSLYLSIYLSISLVPLWALLLRRVIGVERNYYRIDSAGVKRRFHLAYGRKDAIDLILRGKDEPRARECA